MDGIQTMAKSTSYLLETFGDRIRERLGISSVLKVHNVLDTG
jgi:hypothetical protein